MEKTTRVCEVVEDGVVCGGRHYGHGMCNRHRLRFKRHGDPLITLTQDRAAPLWERIEARVDKSDPDGHWWWLGDVRGNYGRIWYIDRDVSPHVEACARAHGPRPDGLEARHLCGPNPLCVNPDHLDWGTAKQNADDRLKDGSMRFGTDVHNALLDPDKVKFIRDSSMSAKQLGLLFSVSPSTIAAVRTRRTWAWLSD